MGCIRPMDTVENTHVVDALGDMWKQLTYHDTVFTIRSKLPWRFHQLASLAKLDTWFVKRKFLAVILL